MARSIVYRYNGNPSSDQVELDAHDAVRIPEEGELIERENLQWRVQRVEWEHAGTGPKAVPVVRLYLAPD